MKPPLAATAVLIGLITTAAVTVPPNATGDADVQRASPAVNTSSALTAPIRAGFFYPWYPETERWASRYTPSLGKYDSANPAVIAEQIAGMRYAGLQAGLASWWGQGSRTDGRFDDLLAGAQRAGSGLRFAPYYECEGNASSTCPGGPDPTDRQVAADLAYIKARYASHPNYLHVAGSPVVFVYNANETSCAVTDRWRQAAADAGFYISLKVFRGYGRCVPQPDAWHQYAPAARQDHQTGYSFSVSAGFNHCHEATPRLARDPAAFASAVTRMAGSGEPWQLVYWNEWCEGSAVESAREWASPSGYGTYADILHGSAAPDTTPPGTGAPARLIVPSAPGTPDPIPVSLPSGACQTKFLGTAGTDRIDGTGEGDRMFGMAGDDVLNGIGGGDCLFGMDGKDALHGGDGSDRLYGGKGRDRLGGGYGADKLWRRQGDDRESGADRLWGGRGNDRLFGGAANDVLKGGAGRNAYSGGSGRDSIYARNHARDIVRCGPGRDTVRFDAVDRVKGCERVIVKR